MQNSKNSSSLIRRRGCGVTLAGSGILLVYRAAFTGTEVTGLVCEPLVSGKFRYRLHNFALVESPGAYRGSITAKLNSQSLNFRLSSVGEGGESPKHGG